MDNGTFGVVVGTDAEVAHVVVDWEWAEGTVEAAVAVLHWAELICFELV